MIPRIIKAYIVYVIYCFLMVPKKEQKTGFVNININVTVVRARVHGQAKATRTAIRSCELEPKNRRIIKSHRQYIKRTVKKLETHINDG